MMVRKSFNRISIGSESVLIMFHLLCFWAFLGTMDSWLVKLGVRFLRIWSSSIRRLCLILLVICQKTTSFLVQVRGMTNVLLESFCKHRHKCGINNTFLFIVINSPYDVIEHRHEDTSSLELFWVAHFVHEFWASWTSYNAVNRGKIFHSKSIGSPSIWVQSSVLWWTLEPTQHFLLGSDSALQGKPRIWKYVNRRVRETDDLFITMSMKNLPN